MASGYPMIKVGQQQSGQPVKLHGVFEGFDANTHRLKLAHLDGIDFSWANTMRNVEVDDSVSMSAIEPGTPVTATLKRKLDGTYYVSRLTRG